MLKLHDVGIILEYAVEKGYQMKTIKAIIEIILLNVFPAPAAEALIMLFKEVVPLLATALLTVRLVVTGGLQKFRDMSISCGQEFKANFQR